jgi:hypothetical protein
MFCSSHGLKSGNGAFTKGYSSRVLFRVQPVPYLYKTFIFSCVFCFAEHRPWAPNIFQVISKNPVSQSNCESGIKEKNQPQTPLRSHFPRKKQDARATCFINSRQNNTILPTTLNLFTVNIQINTHEYTQTSK